MAFAVTSFTGLTLVSIQAAEQLGLQAEQQELSIQTALDASAGSRSTGCFMWPSGRGRAKPCTMRSKHCQAVCRVQPAALFPGKLPPQEHSFRPSYRTGDKTAETENQCTQQGFILIANNTWEVAQRNKPSRLQTRRKSTVIFFPPVNKIVVKKTKPQQMLMLKTTGLHHLYQCAKTA